MSELTTTPEPNPPVDSTGLRINWHRVRVYLLSMLLMVSMWMGATLITIRLYPQRVVDGLLAQLPYASSTGKVYWVNRRTLKIDDVKIGGFFYANSVIFTASPFGLWRHHIAKVQILGGQLFTKPLYAAMDQYKMGNSDGLDWSIGKLEISRGTLMLDNFVEDTSIPISIGVRRPVVLQGIRLGKPDKSAQMMEERTVEVGQVTIVSPFDPLAKVMVFPLTRIRFTYAEFWQHHIREIEMIRPTLFLGQDLFWFTDQFKMEHKTLPAQGPEAPWEAARFEVDYGQIGVSVFGQSTIFPFFFDTKVNDIRLDQLDQLSAKSVIGIHRLDRDYPDYKIRIVGLSGQLYFSWPPTDPKANNVYNTIHVDELSWNGIPAKDLRTSMTFDPNGIYGKLGGTCEGGLLSGNFEFYYTNGFTWNVDFFADKINCQPIAEKVAGKYFSLTGLLNGKIAVQGKATEILNCKGALDLPNPGMLEIKSLSGLLDRLPADTITLKRDALKIALSTFETYPYETGQLKIDYQPAGGVGTLKLDSSHGQRFFQIYWHPWSLTNN